MKSFNRTEWALLTSIMIYSFVPVVGGLIRVLELAGGPAIIPQNPRALSDPFPIVFHILSSFVFCIFGALQFLPSIRRHHPATHRVLGRVVVIAGGIAAATGLWMTHTFVFTGDLQGNLLYWVRMVLGSLMIGLIVWAVIAIRFKNVFQHSAAMVRAYAIGQGASTQAFLGIGWIIIAGSEATGPTREGIMVFAWVLNLLVAEVLIRRLLRPKARSLRSPVGNAQRFQSNNPENEA